MKAKGWSDFLLKRPRTAFHSVVPDNMWRLRYAVCFCDAVVVSMWTVSSIQPGTWLPWVLHSLKWDKFEQAEIFTVFLVRFGCFIAYLVHKQILKHLIWIILLRSRSSHICKTFPPAHTSIKIYTQIILVTAMVPGQSLSQLCSDCSKSKSKAPLTPFACKTGPFFIMWYHLSFSLPCAHPTSIQV